ncbi:MAG: hypothetical protein GPJ54_02550 [Candidatus Heimdallarchaeota archaeon]|nr:hypothetical protein [Candidatus Heimdallarchaeota archaeon]
MLKRHLVIAILVLMFAQFLISTGNQAEYTKEDQINYSIVLSNSSLIINFNTTTAFNITVTDNSNAVENAYFSFIDINLDIEESQQYSTNGVYLIVITNKASTFVPAGNYTTNMQTQIGGQSILTPVEMIVFNDDTLAPILNIFNPDLSDGFNESLFYLIFEGRDETRWRYVEVRLGDTTLLYIENLVNIMNRTGVFYNQTYVIVDQWIDLQGVTAGSSNTLTISVFDMAYNEAKKSFNLEGDYIPPLIGWTSHENKEKIFNRTITLSWSILEENSIKSQQLFLNNAIFQPNGKNLASDVTSVTFFVPIPEDKATTLLFKLVVTDNYDNKADIILELLYDSSAAINNEGIFGIDFDTNAQLEDFRNIIMGISTIVILVIAIFYISNKRDSRKERKSSRVEKSKKLDKKKAETILNPSHYYFLLDGIIDDYETIEKFNKSVFDILSRHKKGDHDLAMKIRFDIQETLTNYDMGFETFMMIESRLNNLLD